MGRVVRIENECHWRSLNPYDDSWRPRAAYVLEDGRQPLRGDMVPSLAYWPPENLVVVPEWWAGGGLGVFAGIKRDPAQNDAPKRLRPFGATVVRPLTRNAKREWHLMDRQEGGFAARSYSYRYWSDLLNAWAVVIGETGQDEHGPFVHVTPEDPRT